MAKRVLNTVRGMRSPSLWVVIGWICFWGAAVFPVTSLKLIAAKLILMSAARVLP